MRRLGIISAFLVVLAACVATPGHSFVEIRAAAPGYQSSVLNWEGGESTVIRLKAAKFDGNLGICGYYLATKGIHSLLEAVWIEESKLFVGDTLVSGGHFIGEQKRNSENKYQAVCVRTEVPFERRHTALRIRIEGPRSVSTTY